MGQTTRVKIVDVAEFYAEQGGGVRTYINQKLEAGQRHGHEVVVIAPGPADGEEARSGGRILWVKGPPMPLDPRYYVLWNERAVHRLLDAERPDIVEGSSPWSGGWFAARWKGPVARQSKRAFIFHQDPVAVYPQTFLGKRLGAARVDRLFSPYWAYLRTLSKRFDATVVAGQWLADKLTRFGVGNATAVPFGIDKERFSPERDDGRVRDLWLDRCAVPRTSPLWVGVSRFHPEKRIATMLEAFARVSRDQPMGFVLFGDGPTRASVEKLAATIPGVVLAGFVPDRELVAATLASSDVFLHGSAAETYGLVVAEAMCSGLPLVVPDVGGAADLVDDSFAETYPAGDVDACARAMVKILSRPRELLKNAVAAAAREKVGTMDDHFTNLFALYASL